MHSKNTLLHLPKSRCITDSRVRGVAERDNPLRDISFVLVCLAVRAVVGCFFAVLATTDVSRVGAAERLLSVEFRFITFLLDVVVRAVVTVFCVFARCFTESEFRVFVVDVCCPRVDGVRVVFFALSAIAPFNIGTTKQAAKNRFRPFISLSDFMITKKFYSGQEYF